MIPTPEQVDKVSKIVALLLEDLEQDSCEHLFELQKDVPLSESLLAHGLAKALASKAGEGPLRVLLEGADALLRDF